MNFVAAAAVHSLAPSQVGAIVELSLEREPAAAAAATADEGFLDLAAEKLRGWEGERVGR